MLLAVNFHYIQPEGGYPYPGIHPTPAEVLGSQLEELGRSFEFVSGDDLVRAILSGGPLPERACVITFDDGLKEQYERAAPVLEGLGIQGIFFVCTQPIVEQRALTVHKLHRLRATNHPQRFLEQLVEGAHSMGLALDLDQVDQEAAARQYLYDDPATRRIKYVLNHVIDFDDYERLVDLMFSRELDEAVFCKQMYMSRGEIQNLSRRHTVGSHAHAHRPLALMRPARIRENLGLSRHILEDIVGGEVRVISYPYGGQTAVSHAVAEAAGSAGFRAGFTMERSVNLSLRKPLLLARVSTNDAPGGKAPLISSDGAGGQLSYAAPMSAHRRLYFDERRTKGL